MKKTLYSIFLSGFLVLAACDPIRGDLNLLGDTSFNTDDGAVVLSQGVYSTDLEFQSREKMNIRIRTSRNDGIVIKVKLPEGTSIPEHSGSFFIEGEKINQAWDISGRVNTIVRDSRYFRDWESCTYRRRVRVCNRRTGQCRWEWQRVRGERQVEYFYRDTTKTVDFAMLEDGGDQTGLYNGHRTDRRKIYTWESACR